MLLENELGRVLFKCSRGGKKDLKVKIGHCLQLLRVKVFQHRKDHWWMKQRLQMVRDAPKPAGGFCDSFSDLIWGQKLFGFRVDRILKADSTALHKRAARGYSICFQNSEYSAQFSCALFNCEGTFSFLFREFIICPRERLWSGLGA